MWDENFWILVQWSCRGIHGNGSLAKFFSFEKLKVVYNTEKIAASSFASVVFLVICVFGKKKAFWN